MLREFKQVKQEPSGVRRWFESDGLDLVVWYEPVGRISGFQICYDFGRGEHALTWRRGLGCAHNAVDSGDDSPFSNLTPILVPDGAVPWAQLSRAFATRSGTLDAALRDLICRELAGAQGGRRTD